MRSSRVEPGAAAWFSCADIEAPVVHHERRVVLLRTQGDGIEKPLTQSSLWDTLQVAMQCHRGKVLLKVCRSSERLRACLKRGADLHKSCTADAFGGGISILKIPRLLPPAEVRRELRARDDHAHMLPDARQIRTAATLRFQPSSRTQCCEQAGEEPVVVRHPVKCGGAKHPMDGIAQRNRLHIGENEAYPACKARQQVVARRSQHVLG